jgi:hypothetical protein
VSISEGGMLREFEDMVKKDLVGQKPYPTYTLPSPSKTTPPPNTNPFLPPPCIMVQGMFQLCEINLMEHETCQYLEWECQGSLRTWSRRIS